MTETIYDVVIIGGGPAGLSCALYTARARLSTVVLDRAPGAGALASTDKIANYPGVAGIVPGPVLLDTIRDQALGFGADYRRATVTAVDLTGEVKTIFTSDDVLSARAVVIATGAKGRAEKIPGEEEFTGRGVSYCVTCDAPFYTDRVAAVVGFDEVAVEEALFLARFASMVHLVCPKSRLTAPTDMLEEVTAAANVTVHTSARAREVVGGDVVTGLMVKNGADESVLDVDGVFMLLAGTRPIVDFLAGSVKLAREGCIEVDCSCATSVPGVYAVGDVTCVHPNQAIIASAEGVIAALAIDRYIGGRERTRVDYM